ncbi:MAG: iron-containing alcohol dehydrogenase [Actinomycetota bacterium]|nr:iron-containing alcohol dehydrogenase [Actinomycetota bacterium]
MKDFVEWFEFRMETKVICAEHCVDSIGSEMEKIGGKRTLIITDKGVESAGLVQPILDGMKSGKVEVTEVFNEVPPNSEVKTVQRCYQKVLDNNVDSIISIGGGSVIDTAKGTAILMVEGGDLLDHQSAYYIPSGKMPPHISVPTTAGTGSESTFAAVIADKEQELKLIFNGPEIAPGVAMLDPYMTVSLPPHLTAATGMDALSHCVEAIHASLHEPISDALALHGIRLISEFLPIATKNGEDIRARTYMLIAANMGGVAFSNALVGIVHAMAHSIGGHCGIHHGLANAILLPPCMEFNMKYEGVPARYRMVAEALGLEVRGDDDVTAAKKAIERIDALRAELGLPGKLRDANVPEDILEVAVPDAMADGSMFGNPEQPEYEEVLEVYRKAY